MKIIAEILTTAATLVCYCCALIAVHILLTGTVKTIRIPSHGGGIINIKSASARPLPAEPEVKKAIMLLSLGNYIALYILPC